MKHLQQQHLSQKSNKLKNIIFHLKNNEENRLLRFTILFFFSNFYFSHYKFTYSIKIIVRCIKFNNIIINKIINKFFI